MTGVRRYLTRLAGVALLVLTGCGRDAAPVPAKTPGVGNAISAEDVQLKTTEATDVAGKYARQEAELFRERMESQLVELDAQTDRLHERLSELSSDARQDVEALLVEAARHRSELEKELERINSASAGAWSDVKAGADTAWQELESAVNKAANRFEKE